MQVITNCKLYYCLQQLTNSDKQNLGEFFLNINLSMTRLDKLANSNLFL